MAHFWGVEVFGPEFNGYDHIKYLRPHFSRFKEYYRNYRRSDPGTKRRMILGEFHKEMKKEGLSFQLDYREFNKIANEIDAELFPSDPNIPEDGIIPESGEVVEVCNRPLEKRIETLADALIDDAHTTLNNDTMDEDVQDMVARKKYATAVLTSVTRLVQGKKALELKTSEEKRNNTSFLMDMLKKATAGTISTDDVNFLKKPDES